MERASGRLELVDVAVNATLPARRPFTYRVPPGLRVEPGHLVFVPFGEQVLQGLVLGPASVPPKAELKEILALAPSEPLLDPLHLELAVWLAERYLSPLWEAVAVCLPPGLAQNPVTMVTAVNIPPLLPPNEGDQRVLRWLAAHPRVTLGTLRKSVREATLDRLRRLQAAGYLTVASGLQLPRARPKKEERVRLLAPAEDAIAAASAREAKRPRSVEARVLRALAEAGDLPVRALRRLGATPAHLAALEQENLVERYERRVARRPELSFDPAPPRLRLSAEQQAAVDAIAGAPGTWLLHGVTGSGKTEVYIALLERVLDEGGGAIVLVPEISLTPQAIRRFGAHFGDTLAVFHSGLSLGERYDEWFRVREGDARLVLGSRSAVFAPVRDLRLLILDEEHEPSFKQEDPQPRYHARDVARFLAERVGGTVVLGSATPSVESYWEATHGRAHLVELSRRLAPGPDGSPIELPLPEVHVVDMREELAAGNRSIFSRALAEATKAALATGEQAIFFTNRRGLARFLLCRDCGFVSHCPSCTVVMGLVEEQGHVRLTCFHCGRRVRPPDRCPRCESFRFRPFGVGTQRIEAEARRAFPGARVARWDSDAARAKGAHERLLRAVLDREVDILVGTQMLAKGLDLPAVSVVGVIDADVALHLPSYTAHERTFQLLVQVAGRAGRREEGGLVFIQTYQPDAPPIRAAAAHDYRSFFEHEVAHRRLAGYPPFARLVRLEYADRNRERGLEHASRLANELRLRREAEGRTDPDILGPAPALVPRVRGRDRWVLLLRGSDPVSFIRDVPFGQGWRIDVDPVTFD